MREVCVFLTQQLYDDNPKFVVGLRKNRISVRVVTIINNEQQQQQQQQKENGHDHDQDHDKNQNNNNQYQIAVRQHYKRLMEINTDHSHKGPQPRLCLVFEQSLEGIRQALKANMTVIGITTATNTNTNDDGDGAKTMNETAGGTTNQTPLDRRRQQLCFQHAAGGCAHAVATSIPTLLQQFHIERYYQVQYLPYVIQLRLLAESKIGYPVSFLDNLSGQFQFTMSSMSMSMSMSSSMSSNESSSNSLLVGGTAVGDADDVVAVATSISSSSSVIDHDKIEKGVTTPPPTTPTVTTSQAKSSSSARFVLDQFDNNDTSNGTSSSSCLQSGIGGGRRVVPRRVLGIEPGSLADVYINNVGWPQDSATAFKLESRDLELDIVRMFGRYYHCHDGQLRGYVTTGGTEGNFTALWWNRDYLRSTTTLLSKTTTQHQNACDPILLTSNHSHYSVHKAAHQLMIEERLVDTDRYGSLSVPHLSNILDQINEEEPMRPIIMNVNLGTTQTGALDPLPEIHRLLVEKERNNNSNSNNNCHLRNHHQQQQQRRRFVIHIDAALMGACLPIVEPFGSDNVNMFDSYDVTTMAISGHKFFGSVCICGLCLTTAKFLKECDENNNNSPSNLQHGCGDRQRSKLKTGPSTKAPPEPEPEPPRRTRCGGDSRVISYTGGLHDRTLGGSRSGFNTLSFHNTLCALQMHTNFERLKVLVEECYHSVSYFLQEMEQIVGRDNIIHPQHSLIVCFRPRPSQFIMEQYQIMPVDLPQNSGTATAGQKESGFNEEKKTDDCGDDTNYQSDSDTDRNYASFDQEQRHQYAGVCILVNVDRYKIDRFLNDYRKDPVVFRTVS